MIPDSRGNARPSMGTEPYWAKLRSLQGVPALYDPLRDLIEAAIERRVSRRERVLDSQQIGAEALGSLPSNWFGNFHRQFRDFDNGDEAGIAGMEIYRQLAERTNDRWDPLTKPDPRNVWDTMLYARL